MAIPNEPITRQEQYLAAMAGQSGTLPDAPITRKEMYLAKAAGQDVNTPEPITREEMYLDVIAESGGGGGDVTLKTLNVNANGTTNAPSGEAYNKVNVSVENTYAASDEGKVVNHGALVAQTSDTATQNGTVDTTLINSLTVAVAASGLSLDWAYSVTEITIGANTITNAAQIATYFSDFTYGVAILKNSLTQNNQLMTIVKNGGGTRFRNEGIWTIPNMASNIDCFIVEGTKYYLVRLATR